VHIIPRCLCVSPGCMYQNNSPKKVNESWGWFVGVWLGNGEGRQRSGVRVGKTKGGDGGTEGRLTLLQR
jgi:hypothetical protein